MERKLHPNFIANIHTKETSSTEAKTLNIQTHFDPTPLGLKKDFKELTPAEVESELNLKISRLAQKQSLAETRLDKFIQDIHGAVSKLASKVSDKSLQDTKVESLIERHNQIILGFEKKMSQLTKVLEEKEAQILILQGLVDEARKDIARMKRL